MFGRSTLTPFLHLALCFLSATSVQAQVNGQEVIDGMGLSQNDVDALEAGAVLAYSDAEYENTKRELAADAIVVIRSDLSVVHDALIGATTVIPAKLIMDDADINDETDFEAIEFSEDDYSEVERLFDAEPGKDFNFSNAEYALLRDNLAPHRNGNRSEKTAAASDAIRAILLNRYRTYRSSGLGGIDDYQRSRRKQVNIGEELLLTTETFKPFEDEYPQFYGLMERYPEGADCCQNYFRWLKVRIQKRPTFALSHTMIQETANYILYTERHYFVTNTLNSAQVTLSWIPYGEGTYMGIAMSASADILNSMMGKMLRPLGRNKAKDLVTDVMTDIRDELQADNNQDSGPE